MDRYVSPPIDLPPGAAAGELSRADLVFYGVSHRGNSYRALVFLDAPGAEPEISPTRSDGLAGVFMNARWVASTLDMPQRNRQTLARLRELKGELRKALPSGSR